MTRAPPIPIQWTPEDDLLLKNAVESGASLEALAKGAIQFSRRFSLKELQDRWYSLLYDPSVSTQASAHMFELEISGINPSSKLNRSENNPKGKEITKKRKSDSIRRKYYAMRKKYRNDIFTNTNFGFFEPNPQFSGHIADFQKPVALDGDPLGQNSMLGDNISDLLELQEEDLDFLRHAFPETANDIAVAAGTITTFSQTDCHNNSFEDDHENGRVESYGFGEIENIPSSLTQGGNKMFEANVVNTETPLISENNAMNEDPHNLSVGFVDGQMFQPPNSDGFASFQTDMLVPEQCLVPVDTNIGDTAQVSSAYTGEFGDPDSLLNLSVDDELLIDVDDSEHKSFIDKVESASMKVPETSSVPLASAHTMVSEDQQINSCSEINVPTKLTLDFTEFGGEKIRCTLNTEDTEIPCNDDIFLLIHPSATFCGTAAQPNIITNTDSVTAAREKDNEQVLNFPSNAKDSAKAFGWPQKITTQRLSEPLVGRVVKTELHDFKPQITLPGFASKNMRDSSKGKSHMIRQVSNDRLVEKDVSGFSMRVGAGGNPTTVAEVIPSTEIGCGRIVPPESVDDSSASDQDESQIEDDVPYFSDVEAMILDMDLVPYDQDSQVIRQSNLSAPSYQYDETKRTLIRLEQGARSFMHRAMTSQGSLAILYGRHLRHYIKKPEVLLGRSTEDIDVDIDLRKEGQANKVSRRQAIIKMDECGSFLIKNLGKSSVSVNGMPIATGQLLTLASGCLIEIRGMSFVFEINERYVKQHLGHFLEKNKGKKMGKSDCLPEDV